MTEHVVEPTLVDYWAGDLAPAESDAVEEHVMACEACSQLSARIAALTETFRGLIPPVLTEQALQKLTARGLRVVDNPMTPGERREVLFPVAADILLHRLGGLDLRDAVQVNFAILDEATREEMVAIPDVPFDREAGTVLVACQKHYASMPPDNLVELRVRNAAGIETLATYTILHRFESAPG